MTSLDMTVSVVTFNLCLESSNNPSCLSYLLEFLLDLSETFFKLSFNFDVITLSSISIKSITINPAKSRIRNCLLISSEASKFVLKAVSSMFRCFVYLPELMSIETRASV